MASRKTIDALKVKERGQRAVAKRTAGMSPAQQLAFWREQTDAMREEQTKRRRARQAG